MISNTEKQQYKTDQYMTKILLILNLIYRLSISYYIPEVNLNK